MKKAKEAANTKNQIPGQTKELKMLGERIKAFRKLQFSSAEKFANAHNFNRVQYSRYERGEDIRFSSLIKVLKALNVSLKDFFSEDFNNL